MSQKELAELAEVSPSFVSNIEKGNRGVSNDVLERIAWALDVKTYQLCF